MKSKLFIFLTFFCFVGFAQSPSWAVNSSDYQFTMTFTVFLNVDGKTLTNSNDKVGAFVNNETRGEANIVYNANGNKYVAYLTVHSNTSGETINFRIYDSENDKIIETSQTEEFVIDANIGGIFQSYSLANPELSKIAELESFNFKNIQESSITIGVDEVIIFLPQGSSLENLTPEFIIKQSGTAYIDNTKQTSGVHSLDFTNPIIYQILSEDESVLKEYTVKVQITSNSNPVNVNLSSENTTSKSKIVTVDVDFSEEVKDLSNDNFIINNGVLKSINQINNTRYTLEVVVVSQGLLNIKLPENKVTGLNNNFNIASNVLEIIYDNQKPTIKEIAVESTNFLIVFSEAVQNVSFDDFELKGVAKDGYEITEVQQNSATNYLVKINDLQTHNGNVFPSIKTTTTIQDVAGNVLASQNFNTYFINEANLSTSNFILEKDISVFPNPVTTNYILINSKVNKIDKVVLFDSNGRTILSKEVGKINYTLEIDSLTNGVYFLLIKAAKKEITKKVIKL